MTFRSAHLSRRVLLTLAVAIGAALPVPSARADNDRDHDHGGNSQWVATWATSPAAYFAYAAPVVQNQALGFSPTKSAVANIQPDLSFPFPNAKTSGANLVRGTVTPVKFQGSSAVTLMPGQEVFSDAMRLSWVDGDGDHPLLQGRNLAVGYSVQGDSGNT